MTKEHSLANLHIVRAPAKGLTRTERVKNRIPEADWFDNPSKWNAKKFIKDTTEFLYDTYGFDHKYDSHLVAVLADQMDIYIKAKIGLEEEGIIGIFNAGQTRGCSPYFTVMKDALQKIITLMNDIGLTPKARSNRPKNNKSEHSDLMSGVQIKK